MTGCSTPGKATYWTKRNAKQDARKMSRNCRAYKCACGYWHLTSQPRRTGTT